MQLMNKILAKIKNIWGIYDITYIPRAVNNSNDQIQDIREFYYTWSQELSSQVAEIADKKLPIIKAAAEEYAKVGREGIRTLGHVNDSDNLEVQ